MTKKTIYKYFFLAVIYFVILLLVGIVISIMDSTTNRIVFGTFKDLISLFIAIPAALLSYAVQRRSAYLSQLRSLWSIMVESVNSAIQYTHLTSTNQTDYANVLTKLSIAIDEVRSLFCNLGENDKSIGLYPFEPLKNIFNLISEMSFGKSFNKSSATEDRKKIFVLWRDMRKEILKEFDREEPTFSHSHWKDTEKAIIYEAHDIKKIPS